MLAGNFLFCFLSLSMCTCNLIYVWFYSLLFFSLNIVPSNLLTSCLIPLCPDSIFTNISWAFQPDLLLWIGKLTLVLSGSSVQRARHSSVGVTISPNDTIWLPNCSSQMYLKSFEIPLTPHTSFWSNYKHLPTVSLTVSLHPRVANSFQWTSIILASTILPPGLLIILLPSSSLFISFIVLLL